MTTELTASITLQENVHFVGQAHTGHQVSIDYPPPMGGDAGFMPLELLLLSVAACGGQTVSRILDKMKQPVTNMEVRAVGQQRAEHPMLFTEIQVEFVAQGNNIEAAALERAIKLSEDQYCPVWAMLKNGTQLTTSYRIVAGE